MDPHGGIIEMFEIQSEIGNESLVRCDESLKLLLGVSDICRGGKFFEVTALRWDGEGWKPLKLPLQVERVIDRTVTSCASHTGAYIEWSAELNLELAKGYVEAREIECRLYGKFESVGI